jgi:hypothetical protein
MKKVKLFEQYLNEVTQLSVSGNSGRTYTTLDNSKYELKKDIKDAKIGDYINVILPKGTIITNLPGGVFANHKDLKDKYCTGYKAAKWHDKFGVAIRTIPDTLEAIENNSKILEAIVNEEVNFPAQFEIGEPVSFITAPGDDERWGSVVKVSFTKAKVFYDILDDYTSNVIGNIDSCFVKTLKSNITLGESLNEAKELDRGAMSIMMEDKYKIKHVSPSEKFNGETGGIWMAADNGETMSGGKIFDYYNKGAKYQNGVLKNVVAAVEKAGWYFSWNDPGTIMLWPKN